MLCAAVAASAAGVSQARRADALAAARAALAAEEAKADEVVAAQRLKARERDLDPTHSRFDCSPVGLVPLMASLLDVCR